MKDSGIIGNINQGVILDAIPVALALFNKDKKMIYRNRAMDDFLIMHYMEYQADDLLEKISGSGGMAGGNAPEQGTGAIFDPEISDPEPFTTDVALLGHEGGSNYSLTIQRIKIDIDGNETICAILLLNDVTMLTRAKIDAEAASHAKSDFLSRMSHEIRTPMNAVMGMTKIAMNSHDMNKIQNCLEQVENSSNHLLGVINDILDFSKIESGKLNLDLVRFSLIKNLNKIVSMMMPKAGERNVTLRLITDNIINDGVNADSLRLNQVLINLISNAIKFSAKESEILLTVRELGSLNGLSTFSFEVTDHGIGISELQASRLFRPFEQADNSITRKYGGTGLGLVISKNLVEMMGGKISLTSKPGEGSTFMFTITCEAVPDNPQNITEDHEDISVYDFSGKRCLVVDDISINREIIIELLNETKMTLETAENGQEAVNKFQAADAGFYDLILMDMQMPVMDGCTAAREIRNIEKERAAKGVKSNSIPIVAMTANVMKEDIEKVIESGMNAHLGKPIELETTFKTIKEQLG